MVRVQIKPTIQGLSTAQKTNPVKPYEEIAEGMETSFTSHLLAEMRKSVNQETPDSSAMEYYNSLMDYERAQLMAKSDTGLGVKKVILDQIVPNHLKQYLKNSHPAVSSKNDLTTLKENSNE